MVGNVCQLNDNSHSVCEPVMLRLLWHVWRKGHTVVVNRSISVAAFDVNAKGWLYRCECGLVAAR